MLACLPRPGDLPIQLLPHTQMNTGHQKCKYLTRTYIRAKHELPSPSHTSRAAAQRRMSVPTRACWGFFVPHFLPRRPSRSVSHESAARVCVCVSVCARPIASVTCKIQPSRMLSRHQEESISVRLSDRLRLSGFAPMIS